MVEKAENKWIFAWLILNSVGILAILVLMLGLAIMSQQRIDAMTELLHKRVSEVVSMQDQHGVAIMELKIQYDPHERLENLEKWQRTFCTGPKLEACALLEPIK